MFAVFVVWPLSQGVWLSFWNWDGLSPAHWAGLSNYLDIIRDPDSARCIPALGLPHPVLDGRADHARAVPGSAARRTPGSAATRFMRAVLFLPQIIPLVAIGIVWRWIFEPTGPLNSALTAVGAGALARGWLGDYNVVTYRRRDGRDLDRHGLLHDPLPGRNAEHPDRALRRGTSGRRRSIRPVSARHPCQGYVMYSPWR